MMEIRIRRLDDGYQYEHLQDNGVAIATQEITAFDAIRSMVGQVGQWEEERLTILRHILKKGER